MIKEIVFISFEQKWQYKKFEKGVLYKIRVRVKDLSPESFLCRAKYYVGTDGMSRNIKHLTKEEAFELMSPEEKREEIWNFE